MKVTYDGGTDVTLEQYYHEFLLPQFGIADTPKWERHIQTDPDNFVHVFSIGDTTYALSFDDYPSGFSVAGEAFVRTLKCEDGSDMLSVQARGDRYYENITGYFMLFEVRNDKAFSAHMDYLELAYRKLRSEWRNDSGAAVAVSRDILQLVEVAAHNHDSKSLYALQNIVDGFSHSGAVDNNLEFEDLSDYIAVLIDGEFGYELYDEAEKKRRENTIYTNLAREVNYKIIKNRYSAQNLGQMVTFVTAMYSKREDKVVEGISISFVIDGDKIEYPNVHFMNDELQKYLEEQPHISNRNIAKILPLQLGEYSLVQGSAEVSNIFRREIEYMNF